MHNCGAVCYATGSFRISIINSSVAGQKMPDSPDDIINHIMVRPDGPLIARGNVEILDAEGQVIFSGDDVALCRCGASSNKPFCDGSHKKAGFQDK